MFVIVDVNTGCIYDEFDDLYVAKAELEKLDDKKYKIEEDEDVSAYLMCV